MKRVIIVGAGLAGLTCALELSKTGTYDITVLERAPEAGGNTSSWTSWKDPQNPVVIQYPMHMFFPFALNTLRVKEEIGTLHNLSEWIPQWYFLNKYGKKIRFGATGLTEKLPAPLHALDIFMRIGGLSLRDKLSFTRMFFTAMAMGENIDELEDRYNFFGIAKKLGARQDGIDFVDTFTYSITNLPDSWQVGGKFLRLFYETILKRRNVMRYSLLKDNYNTGWINPYVRYLRARGVKFLFQHDLMHVLADEYGNATGILAQDRLHELRQTCENCGLRFNSSALVALCPKCGFKKEQPAAYCHGGIPSRFDADYYVFAIQPHQLSRVIMNDPSNPLRRMEYFSNLNQYCGASLTVSRLWLKNRLDSENVIWGVSRRQSSFNGIMDLSRLMPRYHIGTQSVLDYLCDFDEALKPIPDEMLKSRLRDDARKIYGNFSESDVMHHEIAKIYPDVLYHRAMPDMRRFRPQSQQSPAHNIVLAGDWSSALELGMEAAITSGIGAANVLLAKEGIPSVPILHMEPEFLVRLMQRFRFLFRKI